MNREYSVGNLSIPSYSHHQKVFEIDNLKAAGTWVYAIKTRAKREIFDLSGSIHHRSLALEDRSKLLSMAITAGVFDDVAQTTVVDDNGNIVQRNFEILILNEGQIEWLKKKGVKLVGIRERIASSLKETLKDRDFIKEIADEIVIEEVDYIDDLRDIFMVFGLFDEIKSRNDILSKLLVDLDDHKNKRLSTNADAYMLMHLYRNFVLYVVPDSSKAEDLTKQLSIAYPILNMISFDNINGDNIQEFIKYLWAGDRITTGETV